MGRKKLSIESVCRHTHFTWGERLTLQYHYGGTNKYQLFTTGARSGRRSEPARPGAGRALRRSKNPLGPRWPARR